MRLHQNDALQLGSLDNGLRYVLLPNRSPPSRFEAHLEIHAGSGGCQLALAFLFSSTLRLSQHVPETY